MNNNKNSVKLLPRIEKFREYTAFFTEFETNYEVGDKVYIMSYYEGSDDSKVVNNHIIKNTNIDSFKSTGTTYDSIGYNVVEKKGNKIVLNILYDDLEYIIPELILDYTVWQFGGTGSVGQFQHIGNAADNSIVAASTPFGNRLVWKTADDENGGWESTPINIDNTKLYRASIWIRKSHLSGDNWATHFFTVTGLGTENGLFRRADGFDPPAPLHISTIYSQNTSSGATEDWELWVGHIWPVGSELSVNRHPDTGKWDINGNQTTLPQFHDWIWKGGSEQILHRIRTEMFNFLPMPPFTPGVGRTGRYLYPRIDLIDGTEPTVLDLINGFDDLALSQPTDEFENLNDNNYVGRVYIREGNINRGSISGSMLYNVALQPQSAQSLLWNQGILVDTPGNITNIDFNSKTSGQLILKSQFIENELKNHYTVDNNNIGLSIINFTNNAIIFNECNINAGIFNNSQFSGSNRFINNGIFNNCIVGSTYTINNGIFNNSILLNDTVRWINGRWNSDWEVGDTPQNPFRSFFWENGTWEKGIFPATSIWQNGRFLDGTFNGSSWNGGTFGSINGNALFELSFWQGGFFYGNNSVFRLSNWNGGIFDSGTFESSTWQDGEFIGGFFTGSTWQDGNFNGGTFESSIWQGGEFNDGLFINSTWENGNFNGGLFINSTWEDGNFFGGSIEDSIWENGSFYRGRIFSSDWINGTLYFGIMNNITWSGGTWLNGIANNIEWEDGEWFNGVWNFGNFNKGIWYNGSFNNGVFGSVFEDINSIWKFGNFYEGTFRGQWEGGTFFIGDDLEAATLPPQKLNRKFVQYNKKGLMSIRPVGRIPSKRRF